MKATTATAPLPAPRHEIVSRLHRIEGQVRGIERMIEQDRYCIDVLTQVAAATRALQGVALALLEDHIRDCLTGPGPSLPEAKVKEASDAIARLVHS